MSEDLQSELAQAKARAKYYESQCDYLVRLLPNPTFVIDPESNRYVEVSKGYCELLGYREDELCSTIRPSDIHPDELAQFQEFGEEVRRNGFAVTEKLTCLTSNGRNIPVKVYATVTPGREGDTLVRAIVVETLDRRSMEVALHDEVKTQYDYEDIIGESVAIREMLQQVELVSQTDASVLILGETGTGKELICRAIHHRSRRETGSSKLPRTWPLRRGPRAWRPLSICPRFPHASKPEVRCLATTGCRSRSWIGPMSVQHMSTRHSSRRCHISSQARALRRRGNCIFRSGKESTPPSRLRISRASS